MCGLAGCFGVRDEKTITRMLDALGHRGPNDRGIHSHGQTVLGHTRLSIVDVARGHQPILTQDGTKGIICNGEIYNFQKLREPLFQKYPFQTN
jgi:asparagine synthase (glutamine-hydrolysing)